ncbi:MAG: PIN domain-containing protein [Thermodesulfobacteriota bacterium]|nr:PIN domain-containing protein [Thermodesulfobacteriota bacterium]
MSVIIDSSVWIEYFRNGSNHEKIDFLIDENIVVTNDLILSELIPFLKIKKQYKLTNLLHNINKAVIDINWEQLIDLQCKCLRNGLNGVGIPDLIITQNAIQHNCKIYSLDKHFSKMSEFLKFEVF